MASLASLRVTVAVSAVVAVINVVMGTVMYVVEGPANGFTNIPVAIYWASLTAGRIFFGLLDGRVTADAVLRVATLLCPPAAALRRSGGPPP